MWLDASAKDLAAEVAKLDKDAKPKKPAIAKALEASAAAMSELIRRSAAAGGRVKNVKPHVGAFVAYMAAHEGHHRGQVALILKLAKRPLDRKVVYGMWEFGSR
jgi:uncharacterized damage-inducible protein DinB